MELTTDEFQFIDKLRVNDALTINDLLAKNQKLKADLEQLKTVIMENAYKLYLTKINEKNLCQKYIFLEVDKVLDFIQQQYTSQILSQTCEFVFKTVPDNQLAYVRKLLSIPPKPQQPTNNTFIGEQNINYNGVKPHDRQDNELLNH